MPYSCSGTALACGAPFFEATPPPPHVVHPQHVSNQAQGEVYGVEVAVNWRVTERWQEAAGYIWLNLSLQGNSFANEGDNPDHQFHLRSYLSLPWNIQFDTMLYYVDRLPAPHIPSYLRLDLRLGWHPINA